MSQDRPDRERPPRGHAGEGLSEQLVWQQLGELLEHGTGRLEIIVRHGKITTINVSWVYTVS